MDGREGAASLQSITRLAGNRRAWFWRITLSIILLGLLAAILVFSLLDLRVSLSSSARWVLWMSLVATVGYFCFRERRRIRQCFTPLEAARAMETTEPAVGQKIRTALEVAADNDDDSLGFRSRLLADTEGWLADRDWKNLVPRGSGLRWFFAMGLVTVSLVIAANVWPDFALGLKRILLPGTTTTYTRLAWENPPEWFDQRHPPLVRVKVSGRKATPTLFLREEGSESEWEKVPLNPRDNSPLWDAVLTGRDKNLVLYATAGDGKTDQLSLPFEPVPELREANVSLVYPAYIGRPDKERSGGDVRAVEGTEVSWTFVFNTAPAKVEWAVSGEGEPAVLDPGVTCVTSSHVLEKGTRNPVLTVTDRRGRPVDSWRFEAIGLVDELPKIEILEPAKDRDATSITELPVRIRAKDDFGLGEVGVVLEAGGQNRWVLERVIDASNQRQANEMITAMLEEIPLGITDNVRLYAYALDRKPRGGPRALSHLRSIDIRQFKRRWRFRVMPPGGAPGPKMEDVANLEKIIKEQRAIVSEVFVLKAGGRDSISEELFEKCAGQAALEDDLSLKVEELVSLWEANGRIDADDITLLEVSGEQMTQAANELRVPNRDEAFRIADRSLSNLLLLRKKLVNLILKSNSKEGEPMDPKEQPPVLTKLADEARRLAREEADVRSQIEDESIAETTKPEVTLRQQDVAIFDAGDLYSKLLTHPEKTEGALTLMDEAEKAMKSAGEKLRSEGKTGAVLDLALAEQRLLELAEFLTVLEMEMTSEALKEMGEKAEQEAKDLAEKSEQGESERGSEEGEKESEKNSEMAESKFKDGSKPDGKSPKGQQKGDKGESQGESEGKSEQMAKGNSSGKGKEKGPEVGDDGGDAKLDAIAKAARRARLTDEILKALAEREARRGQLSGGKEKGEKPGDSGKSDQGEGQGKGKALADLRKELGMGGLADALEKLKSKGPTGKSGKQKGGEGSGDLNEISKRLGKAGETNASACQGTRRHPIGTTRRSEIRD